MLNTRAVIRVVQPVIHDRCAACTEMIRFHGTRFVTRRVIANVYQDGKWDRVEVFHDECYDGRYGDVIDA